MILFAGVVLCNVITTNSISRSTTEKSCAALTYIQVIDTENAVLPSTSYI